MRRLGLSAKSPLLARKMKQVVIAAVLAALVAAAYGATPARPAGECIDSSVVQAAGSGAFPSQFQIISSSGSLKQPTYTKVTVAQDFEVSYYSIYKVVVNKRMNETYVLYPCGLTAPSADEIPAGAKVFSVPLMNVAVSDTSIVAFLSLLGVLSRVSYVTEYAVNPCMQSLGEYGCGYTTEKLAAANAGSLPAQLGYGYVGMSPNPANFISVNAAPDPGVLNRAEWIKFVATFFNKEDVANSVFDGIAKNYASIATAANAAANSDVTKRPLVAWLYYQPGSTWGPAQLQITQAKYQAQYVLDAGGRVFDMDALKAAYVDGTTVKYQPIALVFENMTTAGDSLRAILKDVDIVIDTSRYPASTTPGAYSDAAIPNQDVTLKTFMDIFQFKDTDVQTLKFLKTGSVLRVDVASNPNSYSDWFETATAQPDMVLRDLASFINPSSNALPAGTSTRIMRNLITAKPSTLYEAKQCPLNNCTMPTVPICPLMFRACNGSVVYATADARCPPTTCSNPPVGLAASGSPVIAPLMMALALLLAVAAAMLV